MLGIELVNDKEVKVRFRVYVVFRLKIRVMVRFVSVGVIV